MLLKSKRVKLENRKTPTFARKPRSSWKTFGKRISTSNLSQGKSNKPLNQDLILDGDKPVKKRKMRRSIEQPSRYRDGCDRNSFKKVLAVLNYLGPHFAKIFRLTKS